MADYISTLAASISPNLPEGMTNRAGELQTRLESALDLPPQAAKALVRRLVGESGIAAVDERSPLIPGSRGGTGWAQWTGPRRLEFENFAQATKLDPKSDAAQYGFLVHELQNKYPQVLASLKASPNEQAADVALRGYFGSLRDQIASRGTAAIPANADPRVVAAALGDNIPTMRVTAPRPADMELSIEAPKTGFDFDALVESLRLPEARSVTPQIGPMPQLQAPVPTENIASQSEAPQQSAMAPANQPATSPLALPPPSTFNPVMSRATWGAVPEFAHNFFLGAGIPIMGATQAAREVATGLPMREAGDTYQQTKDAYSAAREQWLRENPTGGMLAGIAGSMAPMVAGVGLAGAAAKGAATALLPEATAMVGRAVTAPGVGGFAARRLADAARGAASGVTTAGIGLGLSEMPISDQLSTGTAVGTGLGMMGSPIARSVGNVFNSKVLPNVAQYAQRYLDMGGQLQAGQFSTNPIVKQLFNRFGKGEEKQLEKFTELVARELGLSSKVLGQAELKTAFDRAGKLLEAELSRSGIALDPQLAMGISALRKEVGELPMLEGEARRKAKLLIDYINKDLAVGGFTGKQYQEATRYNSQLGQAMRDTNPSLSLIARKIRDELDDAITRQYPASKARIDAARELWRRVLSLEDAIEKTGPSGIINPRAVARAWAGETDPNMQALAKVAPLLPVPQVEGLGRKVARMAHPLTIAGEIATMAWHPMIGVPIAAAHGGMLLAQKYLGSPANARKITGQALGTIERGKTNNYALPLAERAYTYDTEK